MLREKFTLLKWVISRDFSFPFLFFSTLRNVWLIEWTHENEFPLTFHCEPHSHIDIYQLHESLTFTKSVVLPFPLGEKNDLAFCNDNCPYKSCFFQKDSFVAVVLLELSICKNYNPYMYTNTYMKASVMYPQSSAISLGACPPLLYHILQLIPLGSR